MAIYTAHVLRSTSTATRRLRSPYFSGVVSSGKILQTIGMVADTPRDDTQYRYNEALPKF